ncbi:MAG TPA: cytochrome c oxidase assembly protein [Actinomycetota bacterium]|jgi:putative membrane protein
MLAHATVAPADLWGAWPFDPLVVFALVSAIVAYARGYRRWRRRSAAAAACFACGILAVAVALLTPLDAAAEALFSAHMTQHLILVVVAAPLLVAGRPVTTVMVGLPAGARRTASRLRRAVAASGLSRALRTPVVAWTVFTICLWAWHTPLLYTVALENGAVHAIEHVSFLLTSMLAWSVALSRRSVTPLGVLGRALFLVATALQGAVLGALLLFARAPLYPVHGRGPWLWGLTPLEDQQLAGALMWIPPSVIYLAVAAGILVAAFKTPSIQARPERVRAGMVT